MKFIFGKIISAYKFLLSPWLGSNCRFEPTCSEYAKGAVERFGVIKGGILSLKRLLRCHPFGGSGIDNLPEK